MRVRRAAGLAAAALILAAGLAACGDDGEPPPAPPARPSDEEVLAGFVEAERKLDAAGLAAALGAGEDLGRAADDIRGRWDDARKRLLSSLGPKGVVQPKSPARAVLPTGLGRGPGGLIRGVGGPGRGPVAREGFDFASMAWATWSLGLLYLGNNASGTVEHGPRTEGTVTTRESTAVTAVRQGPKASVTLSTTRSQSSTQGWSVSQTGKVKLELPLCPDREGVIAFDMRLELTTTGSSSGGGSATLTDVLAGRTVATVDDNANLASVQITGTYDHGSTAQGAGAGGNSSIHVAISDSGVDGSGTGASSAQIAEARAYGASLLRLAGSLAAARAGDYYEHGYCTEIAVSPDDNPTEVALGASKPFDVRVKHKWDGGELTDKVTAQLTAGGVSVNPTGRTPTPMTLTYVAPNEKNKRATIRLEARSKRGRAVKDHAVKTPGGYAIHDTWDLPNGSEQKLDGVSCDSPYGPWHVVISGDLAANNWRSLNAYYDIELDPATGKGTVTGEEHSVTTESHTYDGSHHGTAQIAPKGTDGYLITMEIDYDLVWDTPDDLEDILGQDKIKGHVSRELDVIAATEQECR